MGILIVRHAIPTGEDQFGTCVNFYRWIPAGREDAIIKNVDNFTVRLWIDKNCIADPSPLEEMSVEKCTNICVNKIYVDVEVRNVPEDLVAFIYNERDRPRGGIHYGIKPRDEKYDKFNNAYKELGGKVFKLAVKMYNRFISFVYANKGQYWLSKGLLDMDRMSNQIPSFNVGCNAKVKSDNYDWVRWCPPFTDVIRIILPDEDASVREDEWARIKEFIEDGSRTDLVLELLANAQSLLENGNRKSAVIEAVSALDVAIHNFAKSPLIPSGTIKERVNVNNLESEVKHLGLMVTVNHLLPILFPSNILTTNFLNQCREAIELRNNVVHNGMRDVSEERTRNLIYAVTKVCKILAEYTG